MTVLFGHPTGNPNSHNAATAYSEGNLLECFCVPWMPSLRTLNLLSSIRPLRPLAQRLGRRHFPPLSHVPKIQGRVGEGFRLLMRASGSTIGPFSDLGNRWLMRTMARECHRSTVTVVHSYEDCSLWQFIEAKHLGKTCVYDMPIGYYAAWERVRADLSRRYADWLPATRPAPNYHAQPEQKRQEMELADLTLVPSSFVERTIREYYPYKEIVRAPYGVDSEFWTPGPIGKPSGPLRFIFAGQVSLRKGVPLLIEAWSKAALRDAELKLVGSWALSESKRLSFPPGVTWVPPCSARALRDQYRESDVFVLPSFFEGLALVLLEAMSCGLPVIASEASGASEIMRSGCGRLLPTGDLDALIELLKWFDRHRDELPAMSRAARAEAERHSWSNYRALVRSAVTKLV